jgi:hypothetical protein
MKKRTFVVLMIMVLITALCFTACGKKGGKAETLESYCKDNPEVQDQIDQAMADSNVKVEIKDNDIVYTFDLSTMEGFTEEAAKGDSVKSALDNALVAAAGTFGNISKNIEESTKIEGVTTTVNYTWGDEVLVTRSFTSADAVEATEPPAEAADEATDAAEDAAEGEADQAEDAAEEATEEAAG